MTKDEQLLIICSLPCLTAVVNNQEVSDEGVQL
jgi:hypothetical protein